MTYRWEWVLPSGEGVAATLDPETGTEMVYLADALVSSSPRGLKKEGHAVARGGEALATVSFDPRSPICVLREPDGIEIAPRVFPTATSKAAKKVAPTEPKSWGVPIGLAVLAVFAVGLYFAIKSLGIGSAAPGSTVGWRAPNGLFIAHYPTTFTLRPSLLPSGMSGATLEDAASGDAIVLVATAEPSRDLWAIYQRIGPEALANVPRADGVWEEKERRDGTCHGEPGAIVVGRVNNRKGEAARLWGCTFVKDGAAYVTMLATRETTTARDEAKLRAVIDATDLTHLEDMSTQPAR